MEKTLISLSEKVGHSVGRRGFLKFGLAGAAALVAPMVAPRLVSAAAATTTPVTIGGPGGSVTNPITRAAMLALNPHAGFAVAGGMADPGATTASTASTDEASPEVAIRGCQCTYLGQCTDGCGHGCPWGAGNIYFCDYYYCSGSGCDEAGYICSSCYCATCS